MEIGLGTMQMTPEVFWNMSLSEFYSAIEGLRNFHTDTKSAPMKREELEDLMERYPD